MVDNRRQLNAVVFCLTQADARMPAASRCFHAVRFIGAPLAREFNSLSLATISPYFASMGSSLFELITSPISAYHGVHCQDIHSPKPNVGTPNGASGTPVELATAFLANFAGSLSI